MSKFDEMFSPFSEEVFFTQYWNAQFLALSGEPHRHFSLMDWEKLNTVLRDANLVPPNIELLHAGQRLSSDEYTDSIEHRIVPNVILDRLSRGATLVINQADRFVPSLGELSDAVQTATGARTFVNLYASWGSEAGLDLHWDTQETFILQVAGKKFWKVFAPTQDYPLSGEAPKPEGLPHWEGMLNDGDLLYLPRGWWHHATPMGEPSLHLTISCVPPKPRDYINWLAKQLEQNVGMRIDMPVRGDTTARSTWLDEIRGCLMGALQDQSLDDFQSDYLARLPVRPRFELPHLPRKRDALPLATTLFRLADLHHLPLSRENGQLVMRAGGKIWRFGEHLREPLAMLSASSRHSLSELLNVLPAGTHKAELMAILVRLVGAGIIVKEDAAV